VAYLVESAITFNDPAALSSHQPANTSWGAGASFFKSIQRPLTCVNLYQSLAQLLPTAIMRSLIIHTQILCHPAVPFRHTFRS